MTNYIHLDYNKDVVCSDVLKLSFMNYMGVSEQGHSTSKNDLRNQIDGIINL